MKLFNLKNPNLKINTFFNALYQVSTLLVSLFTTPYLANIFGPDGVGSYSYSFSITNYFIVISAFGFTIYGTVKLSKCRNDIVLKKKTFWSLFYTKGIFSSAIFFIYLILSLSGVFVSDSYPLNTKLIFLIMSIDIFFNIIDITFLFQGEEKFVSLSLRNLFVKISVTLCIFLFVKTIDDYNIYVLIMSLSYLLTGLITISTIFKVIGAPIKVSMCDMWSDFYGSFKFFIPIIASATCTILSKSLLGTISQNTVESGYYENADKIVNIAITILTSISSVIVSRFSYLSALGNKDEEKNKRTKILWFLALTIVPLFFGVIAVDSFFVLGFLGEEFSGTIILIEILSFRILFEPVSEIICAIYYLPYGKLKIRNMIYIIYALFSLLGSVLLTYLFDSVGTSISIVLSDFIMILLLIIFSLRKIDYKPFLDDIWRCLIAGLIMFCFIYFTKEYILNFSILILDTFGYVNIRISYLLSVFILAVCGAVVYFVFILTLRERFIKYYLSGFLKKRNIKRG